MQLVQKNVLLAVTGGIAAYKTPDLVRKLVAKGAQVRVVMTSSAAHFVSSLSLQAVSGNKVSTDLLDEDAELGMGHIELARWADIVLVAPATANTIAKLAHGLADDLLSTIVLATQAPILVAPAMNQQMWAAQVTQQNCSKLVSLGMQLLGPASGEQACGELGYGRMLEPQELADKVAQFIHRAQPDAQLLLDKHIVITAGPTREAIDPVRYISNHSSGKMGFALAEAARDCGAKVTLVAGPVTLTPPSGCDLLPVQSAEQMLESVMNQIDTCDIFIACAAVADYRVDQVALHKMKKQGQDITLKLVQNRDILKSVAALEKPPFTVGFAAETQNVVEYARQKLINKKLNMIVANDVSSPDLGFNSDENALIVLTHDKEIKLDKASKRSLSIDLMRIIADNYNL